jgi:hypothetical protein
MAVGTRAARDQAYFSKLDTAEGTAFAFEILRAAIHDNASEIRNRQFSHEFAYPHFSV